MEIFSILVTSVFLFSGIDKLFSFDKTVSSFQSKTGMSLVLSSLAICVAIFIEILAPVIIICNSNKVPIVPVVALILFTILATLIYHMDDPGAILKNVSVCGGLLLLIKLKY
jgi:hypothetical protein